MTQQVDSFDFPAELEWVNTSQVPQRELLRGRATLLYFWTYDCVNCINLLADIAWLERLAREPLSRRSLRGRRAYAAL